MGITTGFTPFSGSIGPLNRVTPFTHRDNATFLSILQDVIKYINTTLQTEMTAELERILAEAQEVAANFEERSEEWQAFFDQFILDVTANIATLNDLAIRDLINGQISETYGALDALFVEKLEPVNDAIDVVAGTVTAEATARGAADTILATAVSKRAYKDAAGIEYNEDFSTRDDGAFTDALTGQPYSFLGPAITVTDGFASFPNTAEGGAYASVQLEGDAVWLGGEFKMTSSVSGGGLVVFAMTEEDIKATQNAGQGLPRMSAHLCISPTEITLDVLTTKGTSVTRLWAHQFATPLLDNDAAVYSAYICLNRSEGIAYVIDPTGEVHSIQHSGFQIPSPWVFFEPFRTLGSPSSKMRAKYRRVQADSRDTSRSSLLRLVAKRQTLPVTRDVHPGYVLLTLTGTQQVIPGTLTKVTVPSTGQVRVRINAFIDITSSVGVVMFNAVNAAEAVIVSRTAGYKPGHSGWVSVDMVIPDQTPGSVLEAQFSATVLEGAAATLSYGTDASFLRYNTTFTMEPVL